VGSVDHRSPHYLGDWLEEHRNGTFHYREMHPGAAANHDEVIMAALEAAADKPGTAYVDDELRTVRFGFADQVVASGLVPAEDETEKIVALREALLNVIEFTQEAFTSYRASCPEGTFVHRSS
jgi:hypothetical protein